MTDFTFAHRAEGFDNHIDASIRHYGTLHDDVVNLSRYFVEDYTFVYDIGCSTGKTLKAMAEQNNEFAPQADYIGVEIAEGFVDEMRKTEASMDNLSLVQEDIRDFDMDNASLVTSLFTLQFMPMSDRQSVIENTYNALRDGGAFIFAEKTYAPDAKTQDIMTFLYYDFKRKHFDEKDIMEKEVTLRNMLKPNTWSEIKSMLHDSGFKTVQPFWQNFLFVGAVAIK